VSKPDGSIQCDPITYQELEAVEYAGARAVFKALRFLVELP
jgi:hypothetical protein